MINFKGHVLFFTKKLVMKKLILLCSGVLLLLALSCRKSEQNDPLPGSNITASTAKSYRDYLEQKNLPLIMKKLETPQSKVLSIQRVDGPADNTSRGGGCCRQLETASSQLIDVADEANCTDVLVTFYWTVYEISCLSLQTVAYDFTVDPGYGTVYYGTGKLIDQYNVVINWYCCHPPGNYTVKTFAVQVIMPRSEFAASQSVNTVTGSNTCATVSVTDTIPLTFDYCGLPALAYVSGDGLQDSVKVNGQCATTCSTTAPHVQCPTGGTFYYRLAGSSGSWTSVSITGGFNTIPIPVSSTTNYDYRVSYTYGSPYSCTSPERTGTFTVNP